MADPRAIHEFLTGEVEATTLLLGDFVDLDAQSGYTTYKASVSDIGEVILEDIEYTQDLQTTDKTIIGAINENKSVTGYSYDAYDATTAYATGDLCIYNNVLYKAKQATTGNLPTNTTYWEETSIADEIGRIDTALSGKADYSEVTTPTLNNQFIDVSDSWFYVKKIGDFCYINGRLKLTSAVSNNYGLVFGMPLAVTNSLMMVFVSGRDFNNKANTFIVSCVVSNGTLTIQTYPDSIESGKYLYINSFYVCQ